MEFYRRASRIVAGLDLLLLYAKTFLLLWNMVKVHLCSQREADAELFAQLVLIFLGVPPLKISASIVLFMAALKAKPLLSAIRLCNIWMCLNLALTCLLIFAAFMVGCIIHLAGDVPLITFQVTLVGGLIFRSAAMWFVWKFQESLMSAIPTTEGAIPFDRIPPRTPTRRRVAN